MARVYRGRRKLPMVKMEKASNLQVTFSKRKCGLFKKASELCTLCGVEIGVLVFSPSRKVFSFGNPDIKSVINRFENYLHGPFMFFEDGPNTTIQDLNSQLTQELAKLKVEKEKKKFLDKIRNKREEIEKWWENPPNQLDLPQTTCLISVLENLRMELGTQPSQPSQAIVPQNCYGGSYNNIFGGDNIDLFDQGIMFDVNALNYDPNMVIPNYGNV
ncbi:agamous-like MADS-box protein AGL62 [Eutrema salsugineum]|nr:agamous-like MADS-box protein AGL62 [Eutrema salsugineum]